MTPPQDSAAEDVWCGCDVEGLAHTPGAKGFHCGDKVQAQELARMVVEVKEYYLLPKNKWDAIVAKAKEILK